MNLFFRWKGFLSNKAIVKDINDEIKYRVEMKNLLSNCAKIYDDKDNLLIYKETRDFKGYIFDANHKMIAIEKYKFSLVGISYKFELVDWILKGDLYNYNFHIKDSKGNSIAYIKRKLLTYNYDIDVLDEKNEPIVIALSLCLMNIRKGVSFLGVSRR